jgi:lipopolysaccharide/colanic/teichoic acid biosynthesis glycosyltransferase
MKRALDAIASFLLILLGLPFCGVVALLIKLDSKGPVFFRQERMGRWGQPFFIHKFRTMVHNAPCKGGPITVGDDPRITRVGRFLRKAKIDELPQLMNVLKGEMSLVGPRPEVRKYVELYRKDYMKILQVRPGITDLASLEYWDEAALLGRSQDPEEEYITHILPEKVRLAREYLDRSSLAFDMSLLAKTLLRLVGGGLPS